MILNHELCSELIKFAVIGVTVGAFVVLLVLKIYVYISCGYCKSNAKMNGKTVIVTGPTGGIGKETARELAKRGARVILACRNEESGKKVRDELANSTGNQDIVVKKLDLSSQKSIREFAADINRTEPKLNILIHNAGTAESKLHVTEDGVELTMATNHFGPFLLTHLLIDLLKRSKPSRIVIVASELYRLSSLNLNKLNPTDTWFPVYYYYVSKYANICFTRELARRLEGSGVTANCLHPGMIDSGIWRNVPVPLNWPLKLIIKGFFKTPEQGCQTTVHLAVSEEVEGVSGKYFMDCKERGLSRGAMDDAKAKKLWELSEKIVNLSETDPKI
ncbi:retinol dehydrogenase 14 [Agrilus planipennis]|uniref:Retinol dehydrogenase 14 n=1 Tax=Agrilus planipennis TaxID=224129 RepID=A0A1W4XHF8_AGRPL|nr:retinol dehydrogenase 14 [Agrilus planipennis]XP_025832111.1 retinol dehydrogenase 14 [Agrilus planipennis]